MKKAILCILDGFGYGPDSDGNAITRANAPFLKQLFEGENWTLLDASGTSVGIPAGTQGGSEVGHFTMGAGRIVFQPLLQIDQSIEDGSFFKKPALLEAMETAKRNGATLHLIGMISDQGVHSDLDHALALLDMAKSLDLKRLVIHAISDGRDVPPKSVKEFLERLQAHIHQIGLGSIASLVGRYYAMDRDQNWDRTQVAFDLMVHGKGKKVEDPIQAVEEAYQAGLDSDYYLEPLLLKENEPIRDGDSVIFFNFRSDRARQLTEKLLNESKIHFVAFGPFTNRAPVVFPADRIKNNLGSWIEAAGGTQLRIAETEKYAHVTYFFNSQEKEPFSHEERLLIDSPKCPSYAEKPEMSAPEVTQALLRNLDDKEFNLIVLNFANLDLVGHSGDFEATKRAVEVIDSCLEQMVKKAISKDYSIVIVGDHGNAEYMKYPDASPCPSHTKNPVPCFVLSQTKFKMHLPSHELASGGLQDIAPTLLTLMGLEQPKEMTGRSLIELNHK